MVLEQRPLRAKVDTARELFRKLGNVLPHVLRCSVYFQSRVDLEKGGHEPLGKVGKEGQQLMSDHTIDT